MRTILNIITKPEDAFAVRMIEQQETVRDHKIETVDLTKTAPNYDELVKKIFAANSIQVW
jgi:hypothetical protein